MNRKKYSVHGQVVMPDGETPDGLLVHGTGFGPSDKTDKIDIFETRTDATGNFEFHAAPGYHYAICVFDHEWASETLAGYLIPDGKTESPPLTFNLQKAVPLNVQVTTGRDQEPLAFHSFTVGLIVHGDNCVHSLRRRLLSDADGKARTGLGRGEYELSYNDLDGKRQIRKFRVAGDEAVNLSVHLDKQPRVP